MSQFKKMNFTFNGVSGLFYNLYLVSIGNKGTSTFGVERSVDEEVTSSFTPTFKGVKYTIPSIDITIAKFNNEEFIPFTDNDLYEINKWLFGKNQHLPFVSDDNKDIVYYGFFTKGSKYENGLREGYLNLTFRLNSACAYSNVINSIYTVNGSKTFEIMNRSNVDEHLYPDVHFEMLGDCQDVTITNLTLGEVMSFKELPSNSEIYCYNDGLKQIECINNSELNARPMFNKKWIKLCYGKNLIKVDGDVKIRFIYQQKIALQ